ncbi:acetoacetate--CoA ligase [Sedimenticola thiotaurini]|uniref:Acetoacetyl-CoA synthetase n=1 Tax=Sedimenticola thiotaurini TaxID=1543721 RepID=A0A0F7JXD5_9GAMM|nr:acetoacetate--CoA ligase [Sedimenticola thiotaurini]AKH19460.1 acetoacetyl-CoA synthetase [Sedimenticola thiotaurini]
MAKKLWQPRPEQIEQANVTRFRHFINQKYGTELTDYTQLYQWSIDQPEAFWSAIWEESGVIAETRGDVVLENGDKMPGARWFPQAKLNYAQNLLRRRDDSDALVFRGEDKVQRRVSHQELYDQVSRLVQALEAAGIGEGDRVAAYLPNMPETIIAMLAVSSLGATWSSCSPDFGVNGVVDRFGQIEPKLLFTTDGYYYNGKTHDSLEKVAEIRQRIPSIEHVVVIPYTRETFPLESIPGAISLAQFTDGYSAQEINFRQLPFDHPLYIMFSSGTTGVPKCIVHGAGGTLLQHLKEHRLHTDVKPGDRTFYFTTCGWMMWNWLVSGLAAEATLLLYDGSPFYPDGNVLFDYADAEKMTQFGTSAKFIDAINKAGLKPRETHDLSTVRTLCSTGSPLVPEAFDFVYEQIKQDICLSSISGGTDIISCFALGNPVLPVYRGELQCRGLGMRVEVWNDDGQPVREEKGELVCTAPFTSMPIGFWNDPTGEKYHSAYFDRFPNVWCHGDYVELTAQDGIIIYGRSDAVLNPGGVRIGTAEIYRQVEKLDEVIESLVIGQEWEGDVRVVLFVHLRDGLTLDEALIDKIKKQIRANTTPRHVPARVVQVDQIPRTKSGKIVELAVREVVHNRPVKNKEALANPEALELFANRPELQS